MHSICIIVHTNTEHIFGYAPTLKYTVLDKAIERIFENAGVYCSMIAITKLQIIANRAQANSMVNDGIYFGYPFKIELTAI